MSSIEQNTSFENIEEKKLTSELRRFDSVLREAMDRGGITYDISLLEPENSNLFYDLMLRAEQKKLNSQEFSKYLNESRQFADRETDLTRKKYWKERVAVLDALLEIQNRQIGIETEPAPEKEINEELESKDFE